MSGRSVGSAGRALVALRLLTLGLGVFFLGASYFKIAWLGDSTILSGRFEGWLSNAAPYGKVYLQRVAIPGAPVFARIVPVAEFLTAVAMFTGIGTNVAAALALVMVINFHTAASSFSSLEFLRDGTGPPMFAALLAVALVRGPLPFSLRR